MDCLCPKTVNKEEKKDWLGERKNIRMHNARLGAIIDELEDYYHYEEYKKRFKLLFEFYQFNNLIISLCCILTVPPCQCPVCFHKRINRMW